MMSDNEALEWAENEHRSKMLCDAYAPELAAAVRRLRSELIEAQERIKQLESMPPLRDGVSPELWCNTYDLAKMAEVRANELSLHTLELGNALRAAEAENTHLERWKAEQLAVEASWDAQAVGKLIGCKLGENIRSAIEPYIRELQAKCAVLENSLKLCDMERGRYQIKSSEMEIENKKLRRLLNDEHRKGSE